MALNRNKAPNCLTVVSIATCLLVSLAFSAPLIGCVNSDTITEKVYEQNDDNKIDENAQKLLVNSIDAEQTSDALPQLTTDSSKPNKNDTDQQLPKYGGDTSNALVAAPKKKSEASDNQNQPDPSDKNDSTQDKAVGSPQDGQDPGKNSSDGDGDGKKGDGKNPENPGDKVTDTGGGKNANNDVKIYEDYGEFAEIPTEIEKVTAVGDAAAIVSMLAGTEKSTPLVGADADFIDNPGVKKALANKGISKVKKFWKNDGDSEDDLIDIKKIISSETQLCFVMEGDDTFTKDQEKKLLKNNIIVYVIPNMSSAAKITYAVELIGDILEKGGNKQAGELRDEYLDFHDSLIKELKKANGGIAGGFNFDTGKKADAADKTLLSLYISDWDANAVYNDKNGGFLSSNEGVGIARVGYKDAPLSYYMSVGGVANNAACGSWRALSGHTAAVWQFSQTQATSAWKQWSSIDRGKITYMTPASDGLTWCLMWNEDDSCGLGTKDFPGVIVKTQKMKTSIERDASSDKGIYHPYPLTEGSKGGVVKVATVGYYSGSNLVKACIGTAGDGTSSSLNDGKKTKLYSIYVNPEGMFSSWTDGSMESVLESAWIYKTFVDGDYDIESKISEFYSKFYDYKLGSDELESILAGPKK